MARRPTMAQGDTMMMVMTMVMTMTNYFLTPFFLFFFSSCAFCLLLLIKQYISPSPCVFFARTVVLFVFAFLLLLSNCLLLSLLRSFVATPLLILFIVPGHPSFSSSHAFLSCSLLSSPPSSPFPFSVSLHVLSPLLSPLPVGVFGVL